ncbi:MAG TPA: hypothetical protein VE978_04530 [Chitinophagales bacterium]|nr:hypothetical protein [Chitinophagales bacterium]
MRTIILLTAGAWQSFCIVIGEINFMNLKRVFGAILTILGIVGLIVAAVLFLQGTHGVNTKYLIIYGILGAIFFFTGIGLIRTTKDES